MAPGKRAKGVKANGAKIRDLRLKTGKSQQAFIEGAAIELRTFQRAEKGEPITPAILQQIAKSLSVPITELTTDAAEQPNTYRLYNARVRGGRKLLEEMQGFFGKSHYHYEFDVDPGSGLAGRIANAINVLRTYEVRDHGDAVDDPAEKIRAIGMLNDLVADLDVAGVRIFFGSYLEWITKGAPFRVEIEGGDSMRVTDVAVEDHMKITFSYKQDEFIADSFLHHYTKAEAVRRAHRDNYERGISPPTLQSCRSFHPDFLSSYQTYYDDRKAKERPVLSLAFTERSK